MPKPSKWQKLDEPSRQQVVSRTVQAIIDPQPSSRAKLTQAEKDALNPKMRRQPGSPYPIGCFAHVGAPHPCASADVFQGSDPLPYQYQVRILSVQDDEVWVQFYSVLDGCETEVGRLARNGWEGWRFYDTVDAWREWADDAMERWHDRQRWQSHLRQTGRARQETE